MNLRNWLKKTPRPAAVMADDKRIEVPNNYRAINDLVATVQALEPSKLTCLDKDGKVIRSITLDNESDDERAPVAGSPEMSDLQLFARLLADGYEHGRKANQPIIDSAMQFVERQSVRLAKAEAEIERLRTHNHKLNMQILELSIVPAEEPATPMDNGFMGALLEGAMQGVAQQQIKQVTPLKPPQNTGVKK
jgi:hypothetical protein